MGRPKGSKNKGAKSAFTEKLKHTNSEHAVYAPSKFEQILNCDGSLILQRGLPDIQYAAAQVGEYAHDIGEHCLYNPKTMDAVIAEKTHEDTLPDYVEVGEVADLKVHPKNYAIYLLGLKEKLEPYKFEIEQRVTLSEKVWGRLDCGGAYRLKDSGDAIFIVDYKHGRGVSVQAKDNWQLIIYALAFARKAGIEPVKCTLIVYQPRILGEEAIRRHTYTWDEMLTFERQIKKAVKTADAVLSGSKIPTFKAGKWCEFCKAKFKCTTYAAAHGLEAVVDIENTLPAVTSYTDEQVVQFLRYENKVVAMFKAMRQYLIQRAVDKNPVKGTKIVEGRTNRRWNGKPSEVAEYLETLGVEEPIETVLKLKGIGEIETEIAESLDREKFKTAKSRKDEAWKLLQSVVIKPEGKISIALEDDPRPALDVKKDGLFLSAADLIDDLE